jgi:hypothetical protein
MLLSFALEVDRVSGSYDLLISLSETEDATHPITVRYKDISGLKFEALAGGWIQLMMLRIDAVNDGSERRLVVEEREHGELKFSCAACELED